MDRFTETYIEMVSKAKEIQKLCKYNKGDWFIDFGDMPKKYGKGRFEILSRELNYNNNLFKYFRENTKWLPTLEDLFGIADWGHYSINKNIGDHGYYYGKENLFGEIKYPGETFSSLKEMVLAVVMEINYNKSWNGKVWEERNGS